MSLGVNCTGMSEMPPVRYARSGEVHIAYVSVGEGPQEFLLIPGAVSNVELRWESPGQEPYLVELPKTGRVTWFDKRGTGLSDREARFTFEERIDDIRAVLDAQGIERAHLVGASEGGPMSILFTAMYPQRVQSLTLYGSFPSWRRQRDYPAGNSMSMAEYNRYLDRIEAAWEGEPEAIREFLQSFAPSLVGNTEAMALWARQLRAMASPSGARLIWELLYDIDIRSVLPSLRLPVAVVHLQGDRAVPVEGGRYLASHIRGARLVEVAGEDHALGATEVMVREILENVRLARAAGAAPSNRRLATVVFSDFVGSTERVAGVGDPAWRQALDAHDREAARVISGHGGRFVKQTGDGVLAIFDGPSSAVRCGLEIHDDLRALDLQVRVGIHAGEIEERGQDVAGMAVHIASRVARLAGPSETLVSSTVKDLVIGSGFRFEARGSHALKGVAEEWHLFAAGG